MRFLLFPIIKVRRIVYIAQTEKKENEGICVYVCRQTEVKKNNKKHFATFLLEDKKYCNKMSWVGVSL